MRQFGVSVVSAWMGVNGRWLAGSQRAVAVPVQIGGRRVVRWRWAGWFFEERIRFQ